MKRGDIVVIRIIPGTPEDVIQVVHLRPDSPEPETQAAVAKVADKTGDYSVVVERR